MSWRSSRARLLGPCRQPSLEFLVVAAIAEAQVKAVFNAARRYCVDRIEAHSDTFWLAEAARQAPRVREEIQTCRFSGSYRWARLVRDASALPQATEFSPEDQQRLLDTVRILEAVLTEIEQQVADNFPTVTETQAFLVAAGQRAKIGGYSYVRRNLSIDLRHAER